MLTGDTYLYCGRRVQVIDVGPVLVTMRMGGIVVSSWREDFCKLAELVDPAPDAAFPSERIRDSAWKGLMLILVAFGIMGIAEVATKIVGGL